MALTLNIKDLVFGYNSAPVLDQVSFTVCAHELTAVIGPNGTGKSTLIKCMNGLLKPGGGTITLDNTPIRQMTPKQMAKRFAYVPQKNNVLFPFSVFDMVLLGRHPHRDRKGKHLEIARDTLGLLNIEALAMKNFNELSGGQQQKVSIARAIAQQADIILLDEPTNNLDIRTRLEVMDLLRRMVDRHETAAVLTMHDLNLTARYADKVILLNQGRIAAAGPPKTVLTPENIALVYGVEAQVIPTGKDIFIVPVAPVCEGQT